MSNPWRTGLARNISWLTGTSALVKPIWLLFVIVLCWRYLGTDGYGSFSTALWLAFIPTSLTELGLIQYTIRDVARSTDLASDYFTNLVLLKLFIAPIAISVAVVAGLLLDYHPAMVVSVGWAGVYATALSATAYTRSFFRAFQNLRLEGISVVIEKVLVVGLGTIALVTTRDPVWTLALMALAMVATLAVNVLWIHLNLAPVNLNSVSTDLVKTAIRRALPLGLYSFFIVLHLRAGGVLLEYWHGETAAGEFAPAFRILEALFLLPTVFAAALLPRLSELFHENQLTIFRRVFRKGLVSATLLAVTAAAAIYMLSDRIMSVANPDASYQAISILGTLIWVFPLMTVKDLCLIALVAVDDHRFLAVSLGFTTAVSLILDFILVRAHAADGLVTVFFVIEILIIGLCIARYFQRG